LSLGSNDRSSQFWGGYDTLPHFKVVKDRVISSMDFSERCDIHIKDWEVKQLYRDKN
jgi:hypothetical protein